MKKRINIPPFIFSLMILSLTSFYAFAISPVQTSYCYQYNKSIGGEFINRPMRIASLTKLFSSYFLLKKRGENFKYKTFFWVSLEHDLYIQGNSDPYFLEHGIFGIIKTLNESKIYSVKNIYFNSKFIFHFSKKVKTIESKLRKYFNTSRWAHSRVKGNSLSIERQYKQVRKLVNARLGIKQNWPLDLRFSFKSISQAQTQRMGKRKTLKRDDKNLGAWVINSSALIEYVKILNSYSNNTTTDEMVGQLGGARALESFIKKEIEVSDKFQLFTASGLNFGTGSKREDNLASCRDVLALTSALLKFVKKHGLSVSDLMPTAVADVGTLSQRFLDWGYAKNFVYKSGTLKQKPTSALVAMHREQNLSIVSLGQGGKRYISLKNREKGVLNKVVNKINLKYKRIPYVSQDFLMISSIEKLRKNSINSGP